MLVSMAGRTILGYTGQHNDCIARRYISDRNTFLLAALFQNSPHLPAVNNGDIANTFDNPQRPTAGHHHYFNSLNSFNTKSLFRITIT